MTVRNEVLNCRRHLTEHTKSKVELLAKPLPHINMRFSIACAAAFVASLASANPLVSRNQVSWEFPESMPLAKRQTVPEPGTPAYLCHENCGMNHVMAQACNWLFCELMKTSSRNLDHFVPRDRVLHELPVDCSVRRLPAVCQHIQYLAILRQLDHCFCGSLWFYRCAGLDSKWLSSKVVALRDPSEAEFYERRGMGCHSGSTESERSDLIKTVYIMIK